MGREHLMSFSCSEQRKTGDGKNAIFGELANRAKKSLSVASDKNAVCRFFYPPFFRTKSSYLLLFLLIFFFSFSFFCTNVVWSSVEYVHRRVYTLLKTEQKFIEIYSVSDEFFHDKCKKGFKDKSGVSARPLFSLVQCFEKV